MNDYKLLNRIKEEMGRGKAEEEIRAALIQAGYHYAEVESAFNVILHPIESELLKKPLDSIIPRQGQDLKQLVVQENNDKKDRPEYKYFDFRNIFSQTWNAYIKNVGKILLFSLPLVFYKFFIISALVPNIFDRAQLNQVLFSGGTKGLIGIFFLLLVLLLMNAIFSGAIIYSATGQRGIFASLRDSFSVVWKLAALNLAIYAITALGLFLFVAPGILFALWSFPAWYLVVRDKLGPYQALKKCREYSYGRMSEIFLVSFYLALVFAIVNIIVPDFSSSILDDAILNPFRLIFGYYIFADLELARIQNFPRKKDFDWRRAGKLFILALGSILAVSYLISVFSK